DRAASTPGCRMISPSPSTPMTPNQTSITGPNIAPMRAVPRLCTRNKPIRITSVTGITHEASVGAAISSPSTAESTETAGVRPPAAVHERHQGEHAPFALVVRPDDDDVVLDRDDDQQGPEHEREYAEHVARRDGDAVRPGERVANRVQRARPDVAVHDAQRGECERREITAARGRLTLRRRGHGVADGVRRRSARDSTQVAVMITADATHQRQIACSTNSSIAVRYSVNPNPTVANAASSTRTRRSDANPGCRPASPRPSNVAYPATPYTATGRPSSSA